MERIQVWTTLGAHARHWVPSTAPSTFLGAPHRSPSPDTPRAPRSLPVLLTDASHHHLSPGRMSPPPPRSLPPLMRHQASLGPPHAVTALPSLSS